MKTKTKMKFNSYLGGLLSGLSVVIIFAFTNSTKSVNDVEDIDCGVANTYFNNYMQTAQPFNDTLKAFNINYEQFSAMTIINSSFPLGTISSFRIYAGKNNKQDDVGIVVGVNEQGIDQTSMMKSTSGALNTCPSICDVNSCVTASEGGAGE
jgi:hypothetical protein